MGNATTVMALGSEYDTARAATLMASIAKMEGVESVDFNYCVNKVTVRFDPDRMSLKELEDLVTREKRHLARSVTKLQRSSEVG
jgi:allophanate hydrolase subunit 1